MTAVEVVAVPDGLAHEIVTGLVGPWADGGWLARVQPMVESSEVTSISWRWLSPVASSVTSPSTCLEGINASKCIAPLHSSYVPALVDSAPDPDANIG